jgi:hypothetical protein
MKRLIGILLACLTSESCAAMGYGPTEKLGIAGHAQAASNYARAAAEHRRNAGNYTPLSCSATLTGCPPGVVNVIAASEYEQAERDQRLSDQHRARIEQLRAAERRACAGLDERDRDENPLSHVDEVIRVELHGGSVDRIVVSAKNDRNVAKDRLQRITDCRLARNVALGLDAGPAGMCPLVPGVRATVDSDGSEFRVTIVATDEIAAKALERCARAIPEGGAASGSDERSGTRPESISHAAGRAPLPALN